METSIPFLYSNQTLVRCHSVESHSTDLLLGIVTGGGMPRFHPAAGGFTSGMRTNYGSFPITEDKGKNFRIAHRPDSDEDEDEDDDFYHYRSQYRHSVAYKPKHRVTSRGKMTNRSDMALEIRIKVFSFHHNFVDVACIFYVLMLPYR